MLGILPAVGVFLILREGVNLTSFSDCHDLSLSVYIYFPLLEGHRKATVYFYFHHWRKLAKMFLLWSPIYSWMNLYSAIVHLKPEMSIVHSYISVEQGDFVCLLRSWSDFQVLKCFGVVLKIVLKSITLEVLLPADKLSCFKSCSLFTAIIWTSVNRTFVSIVPFVALKKGALVPHHAGWINYDLYFSVNQLLKLKYKQMW